MSRKTQVAIIGAGPAGLTAAIYLKRAMLDVVIIDKYAPGGKVNNTAHIENYPGYELINGPELATKMYEQALSLGAEVSYGNVQKVDKVGDSLIVTTDEETIEATYVIVASGTSERLLDVPGEATYTNRGVSYCAVCDGSFYKGEEVAVVGGGNAALEEIVMSLK
ncbi:MAG: FAD-binding protein, partial [Methanomicrobia archaeon]|nr:FAD-binding protein [Methanomicrobia archaeon]